MVSGQRFGYMEDIRVCNFCLKLVQNYQGQQSRQSEDFEPDQRLFRTSSASSMDHLHNSLDRGKKLLSPSFYKEEKKHSRVPFRIGMEDEEEIEWTSHFTDDELNTFVGQDNQALKSFVKVTENVEDQDIKKPMVWKSPSFVTRRKFSSRFRFQSESDLQELPKHFHSVSASLNVEINAASVNHVRLLMRQMLLTAKVDRIPEWENVIVAMLLNVCNKLSPDIRSGDEIDIRHYVKIKRIPGGDITESMYVNGVIASKKALHKKMLKPISHPKILLVTFPIEYQRVEGQFISLEVLISQEREHLKNLTARMIRLKPDIIMVEKTVARIAFDFLLDANIVVIPNVKVNVLNAVARCTKADIIHSMDKLSVQSMGTCNRFSFKTFNNSLIKGLRKTFLWIEGCAEQLGCTLILRGADEEALKSIKEIVDFLVFVVYSLKLETCLLQDQYASTPNIEEMPAVQTENISELRQYYNLFKTTILSGSPNVQFEPPFLLQKAIEEEKPGQSTSKESPEPDKVDKNDESRLSFIPKFSITNIGPLSPFTQQNIMVLYTNWSKSSMIPCVDPQPHLIEYYRDSDLTLGQFIEDMCFGSKFICPVKNCEQPMLMHYRTYAHGGGKITVTIDALPCPVEGMVDRIMMWSLCKVCREATPFIPMSEESWKYSFGKYLELTFYHSALRCRATSCIHDVHREHTRFFAFRNLTVRFDYEKIELYNVCGPPMGRKPKTETILKLRQQDMDTMREQITVYYDSVLSRIQNFTYDIVATNRISHCKEVMSELLKKATMEKKLMLQLLNQNMLQCAPNDYLGLNSVYKTLLDNVALWDQEFSNFIRNHLQTDARDFRRITANQIKRIFQEKEPTLAENRNTIFGGGQEYRMDEAKLDAVEKSFLPKLLVAPDSEDELTPPISRRLSLDILNSDVHVYPTLGESPTNTQVMQSPAPSFSFEEHSIPLRKLSMKSQKTESFDEFTSSSVSRILTFDDDEERSGSEGHMYPRQILSRPRPKAVRIDSNNSVYSVSNDKRLPEEDEKTPQWNTITGVAGEVEREQPANIAPEQRPTSIMKTITNLWTGNPANFLPLQYPSNAGEHVFQDSLVVVREDEPSSIVAFALSSEHYREKLKSMRTGVTSELKKSQEESSYSIGFDDTATDIEETLLKDTGTHILYQFWDGATKMQCKIFFAEKFDALRRNCGINDIFEQSLARCIKWDASGGKSGTFFMKTRDDWLVVKKLSQIELEALVSFSPAYFEYMSQAFFHEVTSM
jgi:1-phosphatidylinositol-3-phosphate 5-kinase